MADDADMAASEHASFNVQTADSLALIRTMAKHMPTGTEGECNECGEHFARLVNGFCGRCRDYLRLR